MLGIPMSLIKVKPANTLTSANDQATGGSLTSELVCQVHVREAYVAAVCTFV